jgi:CO/xanthine dehydrogenase FAD-binding subunit
VKPAPFAYVRAASPDQVFDLLLRHRDEARPPAGGQGLPRTLALRLSGPAALDRSRPAAGPRAAAVTAVRIAAHARVDTLGSGRMLHAAG